MQNGRFGLDNPRSMEYKGDGNYPARLTIYMIIHALQTVLNLNKIVFKGRLLIFKCGFLLYHI